MKPRIKVNVTGLKMIGITEDGPCLFYLTEKGPRQTKVSPCRYRAIKKALRRRLRYAANEHNIFQELYKITENE